MPSPLPTAVIIECPKCGTRYQLPPEAIGPKGRKVACAHCGETWQAKAVTPAKPKDDPDKLFDPAEEAALDAAFVEAEREVAEAMHGPPAPAPARTPTADEGEMRSITDIRAAIAPRQRPAATSSKTDAIDRKRLKDFNKRQDALSKRLPFAKVRRTVRIIGITGLVSIIVLAVAFRTEIVKRYPDLAGIYAALGLGVNVVGLEFRDVNTLVALRNGSNVMQVDARIYSVAPRTVLVPPVLVTLLDAEGAPLYEWSVVPDARDLEPGEVVDFTTQLTSPPAAARRVRLTFTDGKARAEGPVEPPPAQSK